jgi:hypothetical protein
MSLESKEELLRLSNQHSTFFERAMSALTDLLGLLVVHVWVANIHFSQIPVILADTLSTTQNATGKNMAR